MITYARRFLAGKDLRDELLRIIAEEKIQAGFILACVGSLSKGTLRMAGALPGKEDVRIFEEDLEVVSAEGTLSQSGIHVHLGLSRKDGTCIGGHLKSGCVIKTTMELVIGESHDFQFSRIPDSKTGFEELSVLNRSSAQTQF